MWLIEIFRNLRYISVILEFSVYESDDAVYSDGSVMANTENHPLYDSIICNI